MTTNNPHNDKESSFPLNSHVEFKKDYLIGDNNNYHTYTSNLSTNTYKAPIHTQIAPLVGNSYATNTVNYGGSSLYNPPYMNANAYTIPIQALNNFTTNDYKSSYNKFEKTPSDNTAHSPFISNYVKDAKSITYDKNINSSFIENDKESSFKHSYLPTQNY